MSIAISNVVVRKATVQFLTRLMVVVIVEHVCVNVILEYCH